jgi:hypothetical protein
MAGFLVTLFRPLHIVALVVLVLSAQTASGAWNAGNFLRFGVGARPLAMGNSFVAIADDATAVYWNPAGLARGNGMEFFVSYAERFGLGIHDASAGLTLPTEKRYRLGMAVIRTSVDDINRATRTDADGRPVVDGTFTDAENAFVLAIGCRIHRILSVGLSSKLLIHQLDNWSANGLGFDLGFLFTPWDYIAVGLNVQNLNNPRMRWNTIERSYDHISSNVKAGCAVELLARRLILSADLDDSDTGGRIYHSGVEFRPLQYVAIRGGFYGKNLAAGASVEWRHLRLDYAYHSHQLGDTYVFTLAGRL